MTKFVFLGTNYQIRKGSENKFLQSFRQGKTTMT